MPAESTTVIDRLLGRAQSSPDGPGYWSIVQGNWQAQTWSCIGDYVRTLSAHFIEMGLAPGDRVAIMAPTGIGWEYCHLATLAAGGAIVGIDTHDALENVRHILHTARPSAVITGTAEQLAMLMPMLPIPVKFSLLFGANADPGVAALDGLLDRPRTPPEPWPLAQPDGLATLIFTSGSTGRPKGVAYTHAQLVLACQAILDRFPTIGEGARFACWLPLSNLFQRIINLCGMMRGGQSFFVEQPLEIVERLPQIKPALFIGVPRFYEKLHAGIEANLARRPAPLRGAVKIARVLGHRYRSAQREGRATSVLLRMAHGIADRLILSRLRDLAGPDLQFMVSGSAPLPLWLMESFHAIGWLVLEAYGTSENAVPIAINAPDAYRFGSVGRPLPQNIVRLADDGELLVRGAGVFGGYYGEAAAEAPIDGEGFLRTGDLARIDADGYVWLTGRKSEVFKTSTGRRIAPAPIEAFLKQLPYVEHAVILGRERPVPVALVCLNAQALPEAAAHLDALPENVLNRIVGEMARICAPLPERDRPAAVMLVRSAFSIAGGELTSNLKLKRQSIEEKYRDVVDALYRALAGRRDRTGILVMEAPLTSIS